MFANTKLKTSTKGSCFYRLLSSVLMEDFFLYFFQKIPLYKQEKQKKDIMKIQELTLGNKKLVIMQDSCSENPREWCNLGTFIDTQGNGDKTEFSFEGQYNSREDFIEKGEKEIRKHFKDVAVVLAVHKYEHSGVGYSTSNGYPYNCPWDSGTVGFIFATKKDIRDNWGIKKVTKKYIEHTEEILSCEIDIFSQWANGDVVGYRIEEEGEVIDSCYGFYGYDLLENGVLDYAGEEWRKVIEEAV